MKFEFEKIYEELSRLKDIKEIDDYKNEINEIKDILKNFDRKKALDTCHKLINKYALELNQIALVYKSNKVVIPMSDNQKSDNNLVNDLIYIGNAIPTIARLKQVNKLAKDIFQNQ